MTLAFQIKIIFITAVFISVEGYFCVDTPVANPANSFITNSPCSMAYEVPLYNDMSAKMLLYHTTVDYSLLVNIPPTDYNNLINKPILINGTNGIDGKDGKNGKDSN